MNSNFHVIFYFCIFWGNARFCTFWGNAHLFLHFLGERPTTGNAMAKWNGKKERPPSIHVPIPRVAKRKTLCIHPFSFGWEFVPSFYSYYKHNWTLLGGPWMN